MIMVKYNGTQKNYNDTDFFCIYMYCTHIYTSLLIRIPEHHIEQILNLFHKWFSICTCVSLKITNYTFRLVIQYWHFHLGGKKLKGSELVYFFFFKITGI